ncbi:MAG: Ig-like domain-containing protein, partial [Leptospiraceae bacterium]|nr:Ig-like domain-containing protein [Leptospiraceae bacterium]
MDTFIKNKAIKIFLAALLPLIISCSGRTYKDALEYFNLDSVTGTGVTASPTTPVEVLLAVPESPTRVKLIFTKGVSLTTAELTKNYTIKTANGTVLMVTSVVRDSFDARIVYIDTSPQTAGTQYTVTVAGVSGADGSSLSSSDSSVTFTAPSNSDSSAPIFSGVYASAANKIELTFNEAIDPTSLAAGNFTICDASDCSGTNVAAIAPITINASNVAKVQITSATALTSGSTYYLRANGVRDGWGNASVNTISPAFSGFTNPSAPRVLSAISNSAGTLLVTYDQPMVDNAAIKNNARYVVTNCPGSTSLTMGASTVAYAAADKVLITGITGGPATSGSCLLTVTVTGITAQANPGLTLSTNHRTSTFYYTIASDTDSSAPAVVSVIPTNANTIVITYSEPVNQTTGENAGNYSFSPALPAGSTISCSGAICTVTLPSPGQQDSSYSVTITGVQDTSGNTMTTQTTSFTGDSAPYIV